MLQNGKNLSKVFEMWCLWNILSILLFLDRKVVNAKTLILILFSLFHGCVTIVWNLYQIYEVKTNVLTMKIMNWKKMNKNLVEKVDAIQSRIGLFKYEIKDKLSTELRMHGT